MEDGVYAVHGHCDLGFIVRVALLERSSLLLQVCNGSMVASKQKVFIVQSGESGDSREGLQLSGAMVLLRQQACF